MRTKSVCGGRRRSITPSVTPSTSPIPLLTTSQEDHIATVYDSSDSSDNTADHTHAPLPDIVPDSEPPDSLNHNICVTCNQAGGPLLVCIQTDCPVTVHVTCIGSEPKFDDSGNFFCPYCSYKRALKRTRELREKTILAKKALSSFLEKSQTVPKDDDDYEEEHIAEPEPVQDEPNRDELDVSDSEERKEVNSNENDSSVSEAKDSDSNSVSVKKVYANANATGKRKVAYVKKSLLAEQKTGGSGGGNGGNGRDELDVSDSEERKEVNSNENDSSVSEAKDSESNSVSVKKVYANANATGKRKVAYVKKSLLAEQKTGGGGGGGNGRDEEEVTSSRTLSVQKQVRKSNLMTGKRRRLLWTDEEEKALKEGVLKYSTEKQNIPWRKILEFGCRVFDKTRTPVDLKDKWKNIISKEGYK